MRFFSRLLPAALLLGAGLTLAAPLDRTEEWVTERARQIKDSDTTAWRRIPWAPALLAAREASRAEKKPLFLFAHDGNIDTGRC
jgi:hypothetical protein